MTRQHIPFHWAVACLLAAGVVGCGKTEAPVAPPPYVMPEVNDANCVKAAIQAMPVTDAIRREFGSKCARRGSYSPSPNKTW